MIELWCQFALASSFVYVWHSDGLWPNASLSWIAIQCLKSSPSNETRDWQSNWAPQKYFAVHLQSVFKVLYNKNSFKKSHNSMANLSIGGSEQIMKIP